VPPTPSSSALPEPAGGGSASLLVEQARMMVQGEEARFIATQSRATTLLAVGGVLAGIGATVAFRFAERRHPWPCYPFGLTISIAATFAIVLTIVATASLIYASIIALGVMRQEIKHQMAPFLADPHGRQSISKNGR
jgi:formate/nitrite transporter FocA (FNT family)